MRYAIWICLGASLLCCGVGRPAQSDEPATRIDESASVDNAAQAIDDAAQIAADSRAADSAAANSPAGIAFFEDQVRPLLVAHCLECHGAESDPVQGGLRLDHRAGWQRGGDLGPAIVPGQPAESLLLEAIEYRSERLQMPPAGRLEAADIATLRRWIELGAPDPRVLTESSTAPAPAAPTGVDLSGRDLWALRPVPAQSPPPATTTVATGRSPEPTAGPEPSDATERTDAREPTVPASGSSDEPPEAARWNRHPLDRLFWAQWQTQGLRPVERADAATLIRRATFDLTGLPPTPAEVAAFVQDSAPDAYPRLIDRLLASPAYGERWGRYWLDVARYADSNGLDENIAHGNAWRYRNYVLESFNRDQPYDDFVREQLAGDLLPPTDDFASLQRRWIATGFLSLGPKVLAEVDETKMELDIIDEQVETVGRAFMALTLGCARCHDHKFDPITTRDYYALAGIFKSTKTMEHFTKVARWNEVSLATPEQQAAQQQNQGELPTAMAVTDRDQAVDVPVHIRGSHLTLGEVVPRGFPAVFAAANSSTPTIEPQGSGRRELAEWLVNGQHPLTARVLVNRLWRWHFGRGLVSSTDNFGALSERPRDPALLDWLAAEFVRSGWSIKHMQRVIMTSRLYGLASTPDTHNLALDPDNHFQWRTGLRRLEAEAIRDSLLSVSGLLDRGVQTSFLHVKNREFLFDHTSKDETRYDVNCRSVYLPVIRNHVYDLFQLFDFADESVMSSDRATTTVAPQALFLLNSELAMTCSEAFAQRLLRESSGDADRLRLGYQLAFGRGPLSDELQRDLAFLQRFRTHGQGTAVGGEPSVSSEPPTGESADSLEGRAWTLLCHTWFCSNEMIYVR